MHGCIVCETALSWVVGVMRRTYADSQFEARFRKRGAGAPIQDPKTFPLRPCALPVC